MNALEVVVRALMSRGIQEGAVDLGRTVTAALDREGFVVVTKARLDELFIAEAQKERLAERLDRIAEAVRREEAT